MTEPAPIRGLWCATLTPLGENGSVDPARFAAHVRGLLAKGVDGVVPFGTTGEGPSFSVAERSAGLDALLGAGISPACVAVATGCTAFTDAVTLTRHALESGCPRCLVLPPFFWKDLTDEGVFRFYAKLIETVGDARLRVYLYHIPQVSAVPIPVEVVERLAVAYPAVIAGVKDSAGDFDHSAELLTRVPQLSILVGHEPHVPRLIRAGGAGTISGVANLLPNMVGALLNPDVTREDEARIQTFLEIVCRYPYVTAFKAIRAAKMGDFAWRALRPPLLPLSEAARQTLLATLHQAGFSVVAERAQ